MGSNSNDQGPSTNAQRRFKVQFPMLGALAALLVLCGCASVPKSSIDYRSPSGGVISLDLPKDVELRDLVVDLSGPKPVLFLGEYRARMNPEVIANSAAGQAEFLRELSGIFSQMAQYGMAGATGQRPAPGELAARERKELKEPPLPPDADVSWGAPALNLTNLITR